MTWHNLPCPPTLHAIAGACPRGWIEISITHYPGNSGFGGGDPQEPDVAIEEGRFWGIEKTDMPDVEAIIREAWMDGHLYALGNGAPNGATLLARLEQAPLRCNTCGGPCDAKTMCCAKYRDDDAEPGCLGLAVVSLALVTTWGEGGKPVYWTGEGAPDYSGQQAAPKPGHGDMWAIVIARAPKLGATPSVIEAMQARRQLGIERYGTVLQADNGRDVLRDLLDETLDRIVYNELARVEGYRSGARIDLEQQADIEAARSILQEIDERRAFAAPAEEVPL